MHYLIKSLEQFRELIAQGFYFEAHECLEDHWRNASRESTIKPVLKGYINGAITLALIQKKRQKETYTKTWKAFEKSRNDISILQPELMRQFNIAGNLLECHYKRTLEGTELFDVCQSCTLRFEPTEI